MKNIAIAFEYRGSGMTQTTQTVDSASTFVTAVKQKFQLTPENFCKAPREAIVGCRLLVEILGYNEYLELTIRDVADQNWAVDVSKMNNSTFNGPNWYNLRKYRIVKILD